MKEACGDIHISFHATDSTVHASYTLRCHSLADVCHNFLPSLSTFTIIFECSGERIVAVVGIRLLGMEEL